MIYNNFIEFIRIPTLLRLLFGNLKDKSQFRHVNYQTGDHSKTHHPTTLFCPHLCCHRKRVWQFFGSRDFVETRYNEPTTTTTTTTKNNSQPETMNMRIKFRWFLKTCFFFFSDCHVILLRKLQTRQ